MQPARYATITNRQRKFPSEPFPDARASLLAWADGGMVDDVNRRANLRPGDSPQIVRAVIEGKSDCSATSYVIRCLLL